jgi:predicted RNA-binding protein with EMAP domain
MALLTDIDVDGLVAARACLGRISSVTEGALEQLESADDDLRGAISAIEEEGSLEQSLQTATDLCEEAVEIIGNDLDYVIDMHRQGRISRSDETVEYVVGEMRAALTHIAEWADMAHGELRSLS